MFKKRIFALIIVMSFIALPDVFAASAEDNKGLITSLGIMNDKQMNSEETVTRAEFVVIFVKLLTMNNRAMTFGANEFVDVNEATYGVNEINYLASDQSISGYGDGRFYPEKEIIYAEAVAVITRKYGYAPIAEMTGGFPNGYINAIPDLTKGVGAGANSVLTYKKLGILMANLLEVKFSGYTGLDNDTILHKYKIYQSEGLVNENSNTALFGGSTLHDDEVLIGNSVYFAGLTGVKNMLGEKVKFYYREEDNGDLTLIYICTQNKRQEVTFFHGDIYEFKDSTYYSSNEASRIKKAVLSSTAAIIYNGTYVSAPFDNFVPRYGEVRLVDSDGDNRYDVVKIYDYTSKIVSQYINEVIYFKDGTSVSLKDEVKYQLTDDNETVVNVQNIKENDVILVGENQRKDYYTLRISTNLAEGIYRGKDEEYLYIDEDKYAFTPDCYFLQNVMPGIGTLVVAYFDIYGSAAGISQDLQNVQLFAYVAKAYYDDVEEKVSLKLFTQQDEFHTYTCAEKIKINDVKVEMESLKNHFLDDNMKTSTQLIIYQLNAANEIKSIIIASPASEMLRQSKTGLIQQNAGSYLCKAAANSFAGKISYNADTIFFSIPADTNDYARYKINKSTFYKTDTTYTLEAYVTSPYHIASDVIIQRPTDESDYTMCFMGVSKVTHCLDEDDEETYEIEGWVMGQKTSYKLENANVMMEEISSGDVIYAAFDPRSNTIISLTRVYDYSSKSFNRARYPVVDPTVKIRITGAELYYKNGEYAYISENPIALTNSVSKMESIHMSSFRLLKYDRGLKDFKQVSVLELVSYYDSAGGFNTLVFKTGYGINQDCYVFEEN